MIKQADVVLLLALLWERFPPPVREANFRYYEPRTGHGSSLSPAIHALVASRLGAVALAERYFRQPTWTHEFLQRACCVIPPEGMPRLRLALAVGDPGAAIIRSASDHRADLVVLGWHDDLESDQPLVAKAVIREMPCPLLMLRANRAT